MTQSPDSPNFSAPVKTAIVGAGAVGGYYGAKLARAGGNVWFLMRSEAAAVKEKGLTIHSVDGDFVLPDVQVATSSEEIGVCDLVIITIKATANEALRTILPPLIGPDTLVLTLQNGLGNEEFLGQILPESRILGGMCFVCINRGAPGVIHHTAQGAIAIGEISGPPLARTEAIAARMRDAGIQCATVPSLAAARWRKLVWNIPFNGLSIAAGGRDTEQILSSPALANLTRELMDEVIATARQLGHELPTDLAESMIASTKSMAAYKPSSLIDWEEGREVEVGPIWEEPLRRARAAGIEMPRLSVLTALLRATQEFSPSRP